MQIGKRILLIMEVKRSEVVSLINAIYGEQAKKNTQKL